LREFIVFSDTIHYKIKDESNKVLSKAAYTCLGVELSGRKDSLGLWIGEAEGANFCLSVLTEIKHLGVKDILIACIDGLKGFPEALPLFSSKLAQPTNKILLNSFPLYPFSLI